MFCDAVLFFLNFLPTLLRFKVCINAHESRNTANINIPRKSSDKIHQPMTTRSGTDVQKHAKLRFEEPTEAFEEPQMRGQLRTICMFEAWKYSQTLFRVLRFLVAGVRKVGFRRSPDILINKGNIFFYRRRDIPIVENFFLHSLPVIIFSFIQYNIDSLNQIAFRFPFIPIQ